MKSALRFSKPGDLDFIRHQAAKGNKTAQKDLASIVQPENLLIWEAFWFLNKTRQIDYSSGKRRPISLSEIQSYFELSGIDQPGQRMRILSCLLSVDDAFRAWHAEYRSDH